MEGEIGSDTNIDSNCKQKEEGREKGRDRDTGTEDPRKISDAIQFLTAW